MLAKLIKLLGNEVDKDIAGFCLDKSTNLILTYCNIDEIPTKLESVCISIAVDIFRSGFYGTAEAPVFIKSTSVSDTKTSYEDRAKKDCTDDNAYLKPYLSQLNAYVRVRGWN